jgi:hypothetical protein
MSVRMKTRTLKKGGKLYSGHGWWARDAQILDEKDTEEVHEKAACDESACQPECVRSAARVQYLSGNPGSRVR